MRIHDVQTTSAVPTPAMVAAATIQTLQAMRGAALAMLRLADEQMEYLHELVDDALQN